MDDALSKPFLPQPGDAGAGPGYWETLGAQTLQPEPVSGQELVSTNHRGHPFSRDTRGWHHLGLQPVTCQWGDSPVGGFLEC